VPYGVYPSQDGHIILAVGNDDQWQRLCKVLGDETLVKDVRFTRVTDRIVNRTELDKALNAGLSAKTSATWLREFEANGVPCGPINNYREVFENEQVIHRGLKLELERDDGARVGCAASPLRLTTTPPSYELPPPRLGQHTDEVLKTALNLSDAEIAVLKNSGAI